MQYSTNGGTVWTDVTTDPTPLTTTLLASNTQSNQAVTVDFGAGLNDISGPVYIRIITTVASTGSNSRTCTAIDDFELIYEPAGAPVPAISAVPTALQFGNVIVTETSIAHTVEVLSEHLSDPISYVLQGGGASAFAVTEPAWVAATGGTLSVTFTPAAEQEYTDTIIISSTGAETVKVALSGAGISATTPTLTVAPNDVLAMGTAIIVGQPAESKTVAVIGANLADDIEYTVTGDHAGDFSAAADAEDWNNRTGGTLNVGFTPTAAGERIATLTVIAPNVDTVRIALSGTAVAPTLTTSTAAVAFSPMLVGNTATRTFTLTPQYLTSDLALAVKSGAGSAFSINPDTVAQSAATATITVTFAPTAAQEYADAVVISGGGLAEAVEVALSGEAIPVPEYPEQGEVIITAVYGAGGNSGATYNRDFVELFNTTNHDIALDGVYLEYSSASNVVASSEQNSYMLTGTIKARSFFLIYAGAAGGNGAAIPTDQDFTVPDMAMAAAAGKAYLSTVHRDTIPVQYHSKPSILDVVAFGTNGSPAGISVTPAPSTANAVVRIFEDGEFKWHQSSVAGDFEAVALGTYIPRNSDTTYAGGTDPDEPTLEVTGEGAFGTVTIGGTPNRTFTISGANLTDIIHYEVNGEDAAAFTAEDGTFTPEDGGTIIITFTPTAEEAYTAMLVVTSAGADPKTIALTGTGTMDTYYTVTYKMNDGTDNNHTTQSIKAGEKTTAPTPAPTRTGHTFGNWYKEAACENAWNFATDEVTQDIMLYAKWTAVTPNAAAKEFAEQVSVYPNPVADRLHISAPVEVAKVEIINGLGVILQAAVSPAELKVSALPSGIYYVRITFVNGSTVVKVVTK
jgi:uncharacterized repeat protein (TIGR02543 family)